MVQASNDIPLPKAKVEVDANTQATRIADLEYGGDKAGRTNLPAVTSSVLVVASPERRLECVAPAYKPRKTVVLAKKRATTIKLNKVIAMKKKERRVRLAPLKRKRLSPKKAIDRARSEKDRLKSC